MDVPPLESLYELVTQEFGTPQDANLKAFEASVRRIGCLDYLKHFFRFCVDGTRAQHSRPIFFCFVCIRRIVEAWGCLMTADELRDIFEFLIDAAGEGASNLLLPDHTQTFNCISHTIALAAHFLIEIGPESFERIAGHINRLWDSQTVHQRVALCIIAELCPLFRNEAPHCGNLEHRTLR
jgi:hypothetical protein